MGNIENPLIDIEGLEVFKEEIEKEIEENSGSLVEPISITKTVGGITSGTTYPKDTGFETIFRDMLNPTENPTLTNPSATLSVAGSTLLESGSSVEKTFTLELNRGTIHPANGTSGYRSGVATSYALNNGTAQSSGTFTKTVSEANKTFKGSVNFAAGEQPKNNKGEDYSSPLPAGSVDSNIITFEFVNAIWSNAANNNVIAKEALISKGAKTKTFEFSPQTASSPEVFDVPSDFNITKIEVLNTLSNKWEDCASEFTQSITTHNDAGGNTVQYKRYSDNRGYSASERSIKITFN